MSEEKNTNTSAKKVEVKKEETQTKDGAKTGAATTGNGSRPQSLHSNFRPKTTRRSAGMGSRKPGRPQRGQRRERPKPEYDQKILSIRRVTRVMAGGRRFSFSVAMLIGDKKGKIGFGLGKSNDTSLAIAKALKNAKKNMIEVKSTKELSIAHDVDAKYNSSKVWLMPNKEKGIVAGGAVRQILMMAGLRNITGKILSRSKNKINTARATFEALKEFSVPAKAKEEKKKDSNDVKKNRVEKSELSKAKA